MKNLFYGIAIVLLMSLPSNACEKSLSLSDQKVRLAVLRAITRAQAESYKKFPPLHYENSTETKKGSTFSRIFRGVKWIQNNQIL